MFDARPFRHAFIALAVVTAATVAVAQDGFDPPWNPPPAEDGLNFTVPGIDNVPDLQGDVNDPQLTVFFAGNQYMVVHDLLLGFRAAYPQYQRVFVETLPPEILTSQIERGALVVGNMRITLKPDIYATGRGRMEELQQEKQWFAQTITDLTALRRDRIGFVFQAPYLIPFLDVTDNVALLPMLAGQPDTRARGHRVAAST